MGTSRSPSPHREEAGYEFNFNAEAPKHIPRGWERLPVARHGHTLWKRVKVPKSRATTQSECHDDQDTDARSALSDLPTNVSRIIKKQRIKDNAVDEIRPNTTSNLYLATLKDAPLNTPRRKHVTIAKLQPKSPARRFKNNKLDSMDTASGNNRVHTECESRDENISVDEAIQHDSSSLTNGSERPVNDEGSQIPGKEASTPISNAISEASEDTEPCFEKNELANEEIANNIKAHEVQIPSPGRSQSEAQLSGEVEEQGKTDAEVVKIQEPDSERSRDESSGDEEGITTPLASLRQPVAIFSPPRSDIETPRGDHSVLEPQPTPTVNLFALDSPQIGTTLLRRESLRRKESPRKRGRPRSPQKKQLKKRDTLQEREILQKFSEGASPEKVDQKETQKKPNCSDVAIVTTSENTESEAQAIGEMLSPSMTKQQTEAGTEDAIIDNNDLQRAVEAIEVCEDAGSSESPKQEQNEIAQEALEQANEAIAKAEIAEARQTISEACEKAALPVRKTRSGARFSDDTSMLKDFLSRAQARKAAKVPALSPKVPKSLQLSPKRSPRKGMAGGSQSKLQESSPKQGGKRAKASPCKPVLELAFEDDLGEETAAEADMEPTACRRSARTRLPAPSKTPPSGPSLIPVRRADGTDPKVLPKSQAQELAIITRANTRRNKGQSKPPPLALKELPLDEGELTVETERSANGKAVAWAETLASYQGVRETVEEPEDARPKVRRLRGLGAVTGAAAAKKGAATSSNGTPAPKRRGRAVG